MKRVVVTILATLVGVAIVVWLLDAQGWDQVQLSLARVGLGGAVGLVALGALETVCDARGLAACVRGRVDPRTLLRVSGAGSLLNLATWDAGEVLKAGMLRRYVGTQDAVAGTVAWNVLFKLTRPTFALMCAALAPIFDEGLRTSRVTWVAAASACAVLPYIALRWWIRRGAVAMLVGWAHRLRIVRRDPEAVLAKARAIDEQMAEFARERPGAWWRCVAWQSAARVASLGAWMLTYHLLGLEVGLPLAMVLYAAVNVSDYLTSLAGAKIGLPEAGASLVFAWFGVALGPLAAVTMKLKSIAGNAMLAVIPGGRAVSSEA